MCWSAEVSFGTLACGTLLNAGTYLLLRRRTRLIAILWYWQYALLMQIPEGIAWLQLAGGARDIAPVSAIALLLNTTQPLALLATLRFGTGSNRHFPAAAAASVMYAALLLTDGLWRSVDIAPQPGCSHLELRYWNVSRTTSYVLASVAGFAAVPDGAWAAVNAAIFLGALAVALLASSCGVGSLFCWLIAFTAPILLATHALSRVRVVWSTRGGPIRLVLA